MKYNDDIDKVDDKPEELQTVAPVHSVIEKANIE